MTDSEKLDKLLADVALLRAEVAHLNVMLRGAAPINTFSSQGQLPNGFQVRLFNQPR